MKRTTQLRLQAFAAVAVGLVAAMLLTADSDDQMRIAGRLGPTPGPNETGYVEAKRQYLERIAAEDAKAEAAALVSFSSFVRSADLRAMFGDLETSVVFVRFPETPIEAIALTEPLEETMTTRSEELADVVRAEIVSLEAQVRDAEAADRETLSDSLERRRQALGALTPDCECIYAIGVENATLAQLAVLQQRREVTLVDVPDPLSPTLKGWRLWPILPGNHLLPR